MSRNRPPEGTTELEEWLLERARQRFKDLDAVDIPSHLSESVGKGLIAGPKDFEDLMPEKSISIDIEIDKSEKRRHLKVIK
ncbi:hypothetical protein EXA21_15305 [Vibrio cincinnatiensis]|uniref:hypothetical protein n=1 Tax=Vibrio cincinnatiensis TaxID=675 RepID=UPI001EDE51F5|nr:hypothetical protein [Vibrio cincinnatiensis]MCG3727561.1 hypothetical protein [Vibrio cincinnatiensis]MCG3738098.1 hypothetical protein [Vibrio cincinnatiensis]MCG3760839.1 hypothetical protein [Vibrio cincinnatiensis]MCG3764161.1 hypothetical protein [Vibrio cincinnatiensis]